MVKKNKCKTVRFILGQFLAFVFEHRFGNDIYKDLFCSELEIDEETTINVEPPEYFNKYDPDFFNSSKTSKSILKYLTESIADDEQIISDINYLSSLIEEKQMSEYEIFLATRLTDLEWEQFVQGYNCTLEKAYEGKLSSEELLDFIVKIKKAKNIGVSFEEETNCPAPDYDKIKIAYLQRDKTSEFEPLIGGCDGPVDIEANDLRMLIKSNIEDRQIIKRNSEYFNHCIAFFENPKCSDSPNFMYSDKIQIPFNKRLSDAILNSFSNANNKTKHIFLMAFSNIRFDKKHIDFLCAKKLLVDIETLKKSCNFDPIRNSIIDELIEQIKEKLIL